MATTVACNKCANLLSSCCDGGTQSESFSGLLLTIDGAEKKIYAPFEVFYTANAAIVSDLKGNTHTIEVVDTPYLDLAALRSIIDTCKCPAASGIASVTVTYTNTTGVISVDVDGVSDTANWTGRVQDSIVGDGAATPFSLENDAAAPGNNKVYGTDGAGNRGWKDDPAGGGGAPSYYNSGEGFWVWASDVGVVTTEGAQGNYTMVIPAGVVVHSFHRDFILASEFTGGGDVNVTATWTGAAFNTSRSDAVYPKIFFVDSGGVQRQPGDVAITVDHTAVAGGSTTTSVAGINGLGTPVVLKGSFLG